MAEEVQEPMTEKEAIDHLISEADKALEGMPPGRPRMAVEKARKSLVDDRDILFGVQPTS
jgi:hypothetical protein